MALSEVSFAKETKESNPAKTMDLKDVECFKCHKKGHYANKCPDAKSKDGKGFFKVRQLEEPAIDKKDENSISQIRIRHSDSLIAAIVTLSFGIGSSCTIWLGQFEMSYTRVT